MTPDNEALDRPEVKPCVLKMLPERLKTESRKAAVGTNPLNGMAQNTMPRTSTNGAPPKQKLTIDVNRRWDDQPRTLTVSFMEPTPLDLQDRIISHMNAWNKTCCIDFKRADEEIGQVRIAFAPDGYWSNLGTDIMLVPLDQPTMNLEGFSMATSEAEFRRVVRHETGHTLGFPHEHMRQELVNRIDPAKAYDYFFNTQGWSNSVVDEQVLTPLAQDSIMGTAPDDTSIMCYHLPGTIMKKSIGIPGGKDINDTDYRFAGEQYPKPVAHMQQARAVAAPNGHSGQGWHPSKDVKFTPELLDRFNLATLKS